MHPPTHHKGREQFVEQAPEVAGPVVGAVVAKLLHHAHPGSAAALLDLPAVKGAPEGSNVSEQRAELGQGCVAAGEAHADGLGDGEDDTHGGHTGGR